MTPQDQIEKKKKRALAGLAIGFVIGVWSTLESYGERDLINQLIGACVFTPLLFALIAGGVTGFRALFVRSS